MDVQFFDSMEDMQDAIALGREQADARSTEQQKACKIGDHYYRYEPDWDLHVYAEILDPVESDRQAGGDEEELERLKRLYASPHMQGFRFARCFSVICPDGELGDIHVSTITEFISNDEFKYAKKCEWRFDLAETRRLMQEEQSK